MSEVLSCYDLRLANPIFLPTALSDYQTTKVKVWCIFKPVVVRANDFQPYWHPSTTGLQYYATSLIEYFFDLRRQPLFLTQILFEM